MTRSMHLEDFSKNLFCPLTNLLQCSFYLDFLKKCDQRLTGENIIFFVLLLLISIPNVSLYPHKTQLERNEKLKKYFFVSWPGSVSVETFSLGFLDKYNMTVNRTRRLMSEKLLALLTGMTGLAGLTGLSWHLLMCMPTIIGQCGKHILFVCSHEWTANPATLVAV